MGVVLLVVLLGWLATISMGDLLLHKRFCLVGASLSYKSGVHSN